MSVGNGFFIVLLTSFLGYMAYRLFMRREPLMLPVIMLQAFALTVAILCFSGNVQTSNLAEAAFILFGVLSPGGFLFHDVRKMLKKLAEKNRKLLLVEPVEKKPSIEATHLNRHPGFSPIIMQDKAVQEIMDEVAAAPEEMLKLIRKTLVNVQKKDSQKEYASAAEDYGAMGKFIHFSSTLYYNIGNLSYRQGDFESAVSLYKKAITAHEAWKKKSGKHQKKLKGSVLGEQLETDREQGEEAAFEITFNLGSALFQLGNYEEALKAFSQAHTLKPSCGFSQKNRAACLAALGRVDEALKYYKESSAETEVGSDAYFTIGKLYMESGRVEDALEQLLECKRLSPEHTGCIELLAGIYAAKGEDEKAIDSYECLTRMKPDDYKVFYHLGAMYFQSGKLKEAIRAFNQVVELKPESYKGYYNLAIVLDESGDAERAAETFRRVIALKPEFVEAYNNLAILLSTQGCHKEALNVYISGLKRNPDDYSLYYNMGVTLSETGRYAEAVEAYRNALEIKPDEYEIYYHLGAALSELKRYDEAVEVYRSSLKIKPSDSEIFFNLSVVYSMLKKTDIAMDNLKKAISLDGFLKDEARRNQAFQSLQHLDEFKALVS